jgi:hypothetical protein
MIPFILYRFVPGRVVKDIEPKARFNPSLAADLFSGFPTIGSGSTGSKQTLKGLFICLSAVGFGKLLRFYDSIRAAFFPAIPEFWQMIYFLRSVRN